MLGIESHVTWQDLYDHVTCAWAHAGNEFADVLAKRLPSEATIPDLEIDRLKASYKQARLVQRRIAFAAKDAAAAVPAQLWSGGTGQPLVRRKLHQRLEEPGHRLRLVGENRWHCENCHQSAVRAARRAWLRLGPCIPLTRGRHPPGGIVHVGTRFFTRLPRLVLERTARVVDLHGVRSRG